MTDSDDDDPPVYFYQYERKVSLIDNSLTAYFERVIDLDNDSTQEQLGNNSDHFGEKLYHLYQKRLPFGKPRGCTPDEILALMDDQGVERLPKIYRQFLEYIGKNDDFFYSLMPGDALTCFDLLETKAFILAKLEQFERQRFRHIFVCYENLSGDYHFFYTDNDDDDPQVYQCKKASAKALTVSDSVSNYFLTLVN